MRLWRASKMGKRSAEDRRTMKIGPSGQHPDRNMTKGLFQAPELRSGRETYTTLACQKTMFLTIMPACAAHSHPLHHFRHPRRHMPDARPSFQLSRTHNRHHTRTLTKARAKHPIRILEHAILQTHHNKLRTLKARLDQTTNILRVRKIQCRVHLVKDVHGRRLELEQR